MKWERLAGSDSGLVAKEGKFKFTIYESHAKHMRAIFCMKNNRYFGDEFFNGPSKNENIQKAKAWAARKLKES